MNRHFARYALGQAADKSARVYRRVAVQVADRLAIVRVADFSAK